MEESAFFNKLRSAGNAAITILAPSDEAFQKIRPLLILYTVQLHVYTKVCLHLDLFFQYSIYFELISNIKNF